MNEKKYFCMHCSQFCDNRLLHFGGKCVGLSSGSNPPASPAGNADNDAVLRCGGRDRVHLRPNPLNAPYHFDDTGLYWYADKLTNAEPEPESVDKLIFKFIFYKWVFQCSKLR